MPLPAASTVAAAPFTPLEEITPAHTPHVPVSASHTCWTHCCELSASYISV